MSWAWFIAGGLAATIAYALGGVIIVLFLAWTGRRRADGDYLALTGDTKPPAAGASSPKAAAPLPGRAPGQAAVQPPPAPGHDCGRPIFGVVIYDGECAYALNWRDGRWRQANHCGRTDFDTAEWEAKLRDR